jgi:hypothetical protein
MTDGVVLSVLVERSGDWSDSLVMRRSGVRLPKAAPFPQVNGIASLSQDLLVWGVEPMVRRSDDPTTSRLSFHLRQVDR